MAKTNKNEIGKGIKALLSNVEKKREDSNSSSEEVEIREHRSDFELIGLDQIVTNPFQPRTEFLPEEIDELAASIKIHGVIQPITVRRLSAKEFQIISGERRYRASKKAGFSQIPAFIRNTDDQGMLELAILENIQRSDLNAMEIALSFQRLIDECELTHDELAQRLAKKRSSISNYLRLLRLPPIVQKAIKDNQISFGHAKILAGLERVEDQSAFLEKIIQQAWSVRDTEKAAMALVLPETHATTHPHSTKGPDEDPEIRHIISRLKELTGSKVMIKRDKQGKGNISFAFNSDAELNELIYTILGD